MTIIKKGFNLVDDKTGEILSDNYRPKFSSWGYDDYMKEYENTKELRYLEAMSAYEYDDDDSKINDILLESSVVAEQKFDGHRGVTFLTSRGNRLFSKRISKKTNWFTENSDTVPHIRDCKVPKEFIGTVLDGEIVVPSETGNSMDVQSITGSLPEKALENQLSTGFAKYEVFDILYYKGIRITSQKWYKRKWKLFLTLKSINNPFIQMAKLYVTKAVEQSLGSLLNKYTNSHSLLGEFMTNHVEVVESYDSLYRTMLEEGKEGLIIKDIYGIYEVGKKSKAYLKMKNKSTYDVVIMGYQPTTEEYSGKELDKSDGVWEYWKSCKTGEIRVGKERIDDATMAGYKPITKPYAKGWIGAIEFGVWKNGKLVKVGEAKGLSDKDLEYIAGNKNKLIGEVIEVLAQGIINKDTGTLRHPRFFRWRKDKNSKDCTWEAHIRA